MGRLSETWPLPDSVVRDALTFALELEHAPMGILLLRNGTPDTLEPAIAEGVSDEMCRRFGAQKAGVGPVGIAFAEHRRITIRDVLVDGDTALPLRELAQGVGFRALEVVPLMLDDGTVIGVVAALFRDARRPSARSAILAEHCGRLLAVALENCRLRAESDRRRELIDQLARARIRFVARLSHELRTPLQSIAGYVDMLASGQEDPLTTRQRGMLERVQASKQILIDAINDLVAIARLETGRLTYRITEVDAKAMIAAAVGVLQPLADARRIALDVAIEEDGSVIARGDQTKVRQILVNLIANAVRLTLPGGTITVKCTADESFVSFEVCDGREAVSPALSDGAFEAHTRLGTGSGRIAGSELGFALSREFAHGMGGSLTAANRPGTGAVFTLRLPRVVGD